LIKGIHHTAISTGNLEDALKFYRDILGFKVIMKGGWKTDTDYPEKVLGLKDSAARFFILKRGDTHLELFEYSSPAPQPLDRTRRVCDHGITHICLEVEDIESEYKRLKDAGMSFHAAPPEAQGHMRAIYGRDPDGNVVELLEFVDGSGP